MILGSTLIVWAVIGDWREADGVWTVPHTAPGKVLIGGPSNAGGLFLNWVDRLLGPAGDDRARLGGLPADAARVPVWQPYLRGERVPFHDPDRRASLHDLDIGHDASAVRRAAYEASGFATRHLLDLGGSEPRRIVATGGGVRDAAWVQALADATASAGRRRGRAGGRRARRGVVGARDGGARAARLVGRRVGSAPIAASSPTRGRRMRSRRAIARYRELAG